MPTHIVSWYIQEFSVILALEVEPSNARLCSVAHESMDKVLRSFTAANENVHLPSK